MTREEAIAFAKHAQAMTEIKEVKEFYAICDFDTSALWPGENCFYYCPNCGAKMDLEG